MDVLRAAAEMRYLHDTPGATLRERRLHMTPSGVRHFSYCDPRPDLVSRALLLNSGCLRSVSSLILRHDELPSPCSTSLTGGARPTRSVSQVELGHFRHQTDPVIWSVASLDKEVLQIGEPSSVFGLTSRLWFCALGRCL